MIGQKEWKNRIVDWAFKGEPKKDLEAFELNFNAEKAHGHDAVNLPWALTRKRKRRKRKGHPPLRRWFQRKRKRKRQRRLTRKSRRGREKLVMMIRPRRRRIKRRIYSPRYELYRWISRLRKQIVDHSAQDQP